MLNIVKQLFNKIQNGNIIGRDENIFENNTFNIKFADNSFKFSKRIAEETFEITLNNLKQRISIHKEARKKVFQLRHSGDIWWLDETDFVFEALHKVGQELDNNIMESLQGIKQISPRIYSMCEQYIYYEVEKRSVMQTCLVIPQDRLKRDMGYTFTEKYIKVISYLEENLQIIENEMRKLCDSL